MAIDFKKTQLSGHTPEIWRGGCERDDIVPGIGRVDGLDDRGFVGYSEFHYYVACDEVMPFGDAGRGGRASFENLGGLANGGTHRLEIDIDRSSPMQHRSDGEVLHRLEAARQNLALAAPNFGRVAR